MISDVHVLHLAGAHSLVGLAQESDDLALVLVALSQIAGAELSSVLHLESLELHAVAPLLKELLVLLASEEGRCGQLETPPWSVVGLQGAPGILDVGVVDDDLVVIGLAEGPGSELVEAVVDDGHVGVRRVGVQRLTLSVVEEELLISILGRNDARGADDARVLGHDGLQALVGCRLIQPDVIHVIVLVAVVDEGLMESLERIVEHGGVHGSIDDGIHAQMKTIEGAEGTVSHMLVLSVLVRSCLGAAETLLGAVLVNAPEVVDAIIDRLLVAVLAEQARGCGKECNVLKLQLENR